MQITPKARLISIIIAVVFIFSVLAGTVAYFVINHLNNANATTQSADDTIGNLFNTDGSLNAENVGKFLTKLQYTSITSSTTLTSPQIASRTGSSGSFVFQMGYYVDPNGTKNSSIPITWQATYLRNGYLTIWMANSYTVDYYNNGSNSNSGWKTSSTNYSKIGNYSNSLVREITKNIYTKLAGSFTSLSSIIKSPSEAGATWQAKQQNAFYIRDSFWSITNGMQSNSNSGSASNSDKNDCNPYNWSWNSSVYSDKFWLPSYVEIFNTSDQTTTYNNRGLWGITSTDDRKDTSSTALDGKRTSQYCWLRSGCSSYNNYATRVNTSGSAGFNLVNYSHGIRPAAHLSLKALEDALPSQYTISVNTNNTTYGTISTVGGTYYKGTSVTLTATPNVHYQFVRWERNGVQVSTNASYTFTVSGSYTYTAVFEPCSYTITTNVSPAGAGSVSGGGAYNYNTTVTFTAAANTGYNFLGWDINGDGAVDSMANPYSHRVTGNTTITAIFEPATYTVIMETSGYPSLVGGLAGGFENTGWNGTYGTEHVRSGSYSLKITANTSTPEVTIPTTTAVPIVVDNIDKRNHVYYFQYWGYQETRAGASTQIYWPIEEPSMGSIALGPAGQWNMYSFYGTRSNNSTTTSSVRIDFDNANQAGTIWFDDFLMLDLTDIFGAGNEPSKEWCDMHIISGTNTQTIQYDTSTTLETRPGGDSTIYTFAGWSTTPKTTNTTNQTVQYSNGGTVSNLTNAGGSITLYGIWEYRPFARASATLGGEVRMSGNDLGTGTTSTTVSYEAIPYTGYYLIGWYVGDMLYTENGTTYTGTTLTLPREQAEGVVVVPVFSTNTTGTPSLSFDLDNNTAITASVGGEARIIGDTYSTTDTVTLIAAVQMQGYRFVGWYIDGIQVSTDETAILSRATVLGKIVQARFAPIDNSTTNDDIDNNQTGDFVFL